MISRWHFIVLVCAAACTNTSAEGILCGANKTCPSGYACASDNRCHAGALPADLQSSVDDALFTNNADGDQVENDGAPNCGAIGQACCAGNGCNADACCGTGGKCQASYSSVVMQDQPVNYWPFDETTGTLHGAVGGDLGTIHGGVTEHIAGALSCGDYAIGIDGTSGYVDFGNVANANFGIGDFSIEFWTKVKPSSDVAYFLSKRVIAACGNSNFWNLAINTTGGTIEVDVDTAATAHAATLWSDAAVFDNAWHHFVFTRSGLALSVYIDGTLNTTSPAAAVANLDNTASMQIGWVSNCGNDYFPGSAMDELAIYHGALSATRIKAHYQAR